MKINKPKALVAIVLCSLVGWSCSTEPSTVQENIELIRLDEQIMAAESPEQLTQFFVENDYYTRLLYRTMPSDTSLSNYVFNIVSHPDTKKFYKETINTYGDFTQLKADLNNAFTGIKREFPEFKAPQVYTTFTGLENDLYVSDSTVIISIESFLGPEASYRPVQPDYILRRYDQQHLVPQIVRLLANSYIEQNQGTTLLNDMVYFGKTFEFTKSVLPDTPENIIIGYPDSSMTQTWYAQDIVWAHFIENELLYEQSPRVKQKYLDERPNVNEIGPACPGRIAQWVGWRIIQKYRTENSGLSLKEVLKAKDPQEILRVSQYRGEVE